MSVLNTMSVRLCLGIVEKEIWLIRLYEHYEFFRHILLGYRYPKTVKVL